MILPRPYRTSVAPSAKRTSSRNHMFSRGWLSRRLKIDHTTVPSTAENDSVAARIQSISLSPLPDNAMGIGPLMRKR